MKSSRRYLYYQFLIVVFFVASTILTEWLDVPSFLGDPPTSPLARKHEILIELSFALLLFLLELFWTYNLIRNIKILEGLLPICANCKKIREGTDWKAVEDYVSTHSLVDFTHSLCPECQKKLYPNLDLH